MARSEDRQRNIDEESRASAERGRAAAEKQRVTAENGREERLGLEENRRMIEEAKREIENQKMAAIIEVKNAAGELVLGVSEKILRRELNNKDEQVKYINSLISQSKLN